MSLVIDSPEDFYVFSFLVEPINFNYIRKKAHGFKTFGHQGLD